MIPWCWLHFFVVWLYISKTYVNSTLIYIEEAPKYIDCVTFLKNMSALCRYLTHTFGDFCLLKWKSEEAFLYLFLVLNVRSVGWMLKYWDLGTFWWFVEVSVSIRPLLENFRLHLILAGGVQLLSRPHGLQHARLPYLSLSPRVCSNTCPLSLIFRKR